MMNALPSFDLFHFLLDYEEFEMTYVSLEFR